jgi:hypothetical protein
MITDNDGRAKSAYIRMNRKLCSGHQKPHQGKKTFQMDMIHFLQNSIAAF